MTLTEMLQNTLFHADNVIPSTGDQDNDSEQYLQLLKGTFKEWLEAVGLPQYYNPDGLCFNATESLRKLLITLVDEP